MATEKINKKKARRDSRIIAVEALFYFLAREDERTWEECLSHVLDEVVLQDTDEFAESLVKTAAENAKKMRVVVRAFAPEFAFEKIAAINRTLLILGLVEMKYFETPPIVVINEYIELAKDFGEDRSAAFINGVLDAFRKNIGKGAEPKQESL
jgi:N utilization substance protein B